MSVNSKRTFNLFIFGLGYSSLAIARVAIAQGFSVAGTVRTPEKAAALQKQGIDAYVFPSPLRGEPPILNPSPLRGEGGGEGGYQQKPAARMISLSQSLRRNQTHVEKLLWYQIRNRQIGNAKFRRQEPIGSYIVDFLCAEHKLIIELDGGQHNESSKDKVRDNYLAEEGYSILRFWNHDVLQNLEAVLQTIYDAVLKSPPHPHPLPAGEREKFNVSLPAGESELLVRLSSATHILSSIPPQETGDIVLPLIAHHSSLIPHLSYLSTTGVYGDWGGAWVDESSELRPNSERLKRRVAAEKAWLARGGHVFRLAGIYGPGRNALEDVISGEARRIDKPDQVFSRIHVDDIAQTVVASMLRSSSDLSAEGEAVAQNPRSSSEAVAQRIYNICDDEPAPAHEVVRYACELLGKEPPPLIPYAQAEMSPMGREFYAANRRVKNDRIKENLGIKLYYPSYREGLQALARTLQNR